MSEIREHEYLKSIDPSIPKSNVFEEYFKSRPDNTVVGSMITSKELDEMIKDEETWLKQQP